MTLDADKNLEDKTLDITIDELLGKMKVFQEKKEKEEKENEKFIAERLNDIDSFF